MIHARWWPLRSRWAQLPVIYRVVQTGDIMASSRGVRQRSTKGYEQVAHDDESFHQFFVQQEKTSTVLGVELTEEEAIMCEIVIASSHEAA